MATTEAPSRPGDRVSAGRGGYAIVCLSRQDWEARLPTNRQQIMRRAAERGHEVLFVETGNFTGTRAVRWLRGRDRGFLRRLLSAERVEPRLRVRRSLNLLPWGQRYALPAGVNRRLTARAVSRLVKRLPKPVVLWIYDPIAFRRPGEYGEDLVVYDVVDDYAKQVDPKRHDFVAAADERTGRASRLVFATTAPLRDRHRRQNDRTHLVRNVGDFSHFAQAANRALAAPDVAGLRRPVVGFAGNFVSSKLDFDLLDALAATLPEGTLLLIGPAEGQEGERLRRLAERSNVCWVGFRPYEDLPRYVAAFDVALIPYVENDYTRSCFPLKLYEYLAAGKPVVASGLPELAGMEPDVVLARGLEEFSAGIRAALDLRSDADVARRGALASGNTWDTRTDRLLGLVEDALREI
jgi:glycosyltransferase involved in cell wall biosynthesis